MLKSAMLVVYGGLLYMLSNELADVKWWCGGATGNGCVLQVGTPAPDVHGGTSWRERATEWKECK